MDSTQPGKHFERERCSENEGSAAKESDQLCAHNVTECVSTKEPQVSEELDTFCRESGGGYESTADIDTILRHIRRFESGSAAGAETASPLSPTGAGEEESSPPSDTRTHDKSVDENGTDVDNGRAHDPDEKCELDERSLSAESSPGEVESPEQELARKRKIFEQRENVNPLVVTREAHHGEEEIHSENAMNAIRFWRTCYAELDALRTRLGSQYRTREYLVCRDRILSVEIYLIEEQGLTIPNFLESGRRSAWDGLQRNEHVVLRRMNRMSLTEEYERARKNELREASMQMLKGILTFPARLLHGRRRNSK